MSKNKLFFSLIVLFFISQVLFISYWVFFQPRYTEIVCTSSFTHNLIGESNSYFNGEMTLTLKKNGRGNVTVEGKTTGENRLIFHKAFFFNYYLDELGVLHGKINSVQKAKNDQIDVNHFGMKFIELKFQLRGGLRINKFKNVYILSVPGLIINTCVPV
ncbi:TPA: hypothetical protein ACNFPD_003366 [Enterobacter cancerogenus]